MINQMPIETRIYLGLSLAVITAFTLGVPMPGVAFQTLALVVGVALIGLPHGALDPLLAKRAGLIGNQRNFVAFHAAYIGMAALILALWLVLPTIALAVFLLYSANHFAGDWMNRRAIIRTALGAALLSLPALNYMPEVAEIYALLSGDSARHIAEIQNFLAPIWLLILGVTVVTSLFKKRVSNALEVATLGISAMLLPPLVFFLIYFCGLHSPRHFLHIWRTSPDRGLASRIVAGYTLATIAIAVPITLALGEPENVTASMQRVVFIGLAALTVPHMILSTILEARARV